MELVIQRKDYLYRIAWSYLHSEHEVQDVLQETIVKAFHDVADLRNPEYFYTWYTRILINLCKQSLNHRKKVINIEEIRGKVESAAYNYEDSIDIESSMKKLSQEHREVIFMRYMEDLTVKDIAEILNLPEGTVKSRIYYGICNLRKYIGERVVNRYEL